MMYFFFRALLRLYYKVMYRYESIGEQNVPINGPVLLCSNHQSVLDPCSVALPLERRVYYMAKEELFRVPLFGKLIHHLGALPVKRGAVGKDTLRRAVNLLSEDKMLCMFPQGTRSTTNFQGKRGAAVLAERTGASIIPVAIIGKYKPFRKMKIIYGTPVILTNPVEAGSMTQQITDQLMTDIVDLLKVQ